MSIISWKCWGLGYPSVVLSLRDLVRLYQPDVMFLCDLAFAVDKVGRGGGLAILWKHPFECTVTRYSSNFIDMEVSENHCSIWRLTCLYECPRSGRRRILGTC